MLLLSLCLLLVVSAAHEFRVCHGHSDAFGLSDVELLPDPVQGHVPLVVKFKGTPTKGFSGGSATLSVKLMGLKIASLNFDVCSDLGIKCPVQEGEETTGSISYYVPTDVIPGLVANVEFQLSDQDGGEITCITVDARMGGSPQMKSLRGGAGDEVHLQAEE